MGAKTCHVFGMKKSPDKTTLLDAYRVPGFRLCAHVDGYTLAKPVFVITLERRSKKVCAAGAVRRAGPFTTRAGVVCAILGAGIEKSISIFKCAA
jgi:hypothetical protein